MTALKVEPSPTGLRLDDGTRQVELTWHELAASVWPDDGVLLSPGEVTGRLDTIDIADPEQAHSQAEGLLLAGAPAQVRRAYERLKARSVWREVG